MLQKALFSFLLILVIAQVVALKPALLTISEYSVGELTSATTSIATQTNKPSAQATLTTASNNQEYDSVVFVGDIMLGRHVEMLLDRNGSDYPYQGLALKGISAFPAVVANFESAAAVEHTRTPVGAMQFSVSEKYFAALGEQITHASLANNHALDFGEAGYHNAVTLLEQNGVVAFGHTQVIDKNSIAFLETQRGDIAIIGINATSRIPTEGEIFYVCSKAKRRSDFQVFSIHWGDEYKITHSDTQRILAEVMVDACADLIIGHHPHVVQDIDLIAGVPVFYSLGNYIFDQYFSTEVKEGLVVALMLDEVPSLKLMPVTSEQQQSVPTPQGEDETTMFLSTLAKRSHPSLQSAIESGVVRLFEPVATSTKIAIMSR